MVKQQAEIQKKNMSKKSENIQVQVHWLKCYKKESVEHIVWAAGQV